MTREELFTVVAVVRLLWQAERDTSIRALLDPLMDHRDGKEDDEGRKKIAVFLSKRGLEEEAVLRVLGVLQTNGVTSRSAGGLPQAHALYPVFSITNHSCVSNTRHGREGEAFCLVATVNIPKGTEITTSYNSPSLGSIVRRPQFRRLWHFDCTCPRCADPAELGTLASALACSSCPGHFLPEKPLDHNSDWGCKRWNPENTLNPYVTNVVLDHSFIEPRLGLSPCNLSDQRSCMYHQVWCHHVTR